METNIYNLKTEKIILNNRVHENPYQP